MPASQFPPLEAKPSTRRCCNCKAGMSAYVLPAHYGRNVELDVCLACNAIWFDSSESAQLAPDGTVAMFQLIHERGGGATRATEKLGEVMQCLQCGDRMRLIRDRVLNSTFVYQTCPSGHGRFTTFYNFLLEKRFVRELTLAERDRLAVSVKEIRCAGCGAAVSLGKADACEYCRAPISVFDRDAAKKAIDHYLERRNMHLPSAAPPQYRPGAAGLSRGYMPAQGNAAIYDRADFAADILFALGNAAARGLAGAGRAAPAAASGSALADAAEAAGTVASEGVVDLVADGIGSFLGGIFS